MITYDFIFRNNGTYERDLRQQGYTRSQLKNRFQHLRIILAPELDGIIHYQRGGPVAIYDGKVFITYAVMMDGGK